MKKLFLLIMLVTILFMGCKSTKPAQQKESASPAQQPVSNVTILDITEKEWKLIEVRINGENTGFNRATLTRDGFGDVFTLSFNEGMVSGMGAPNRYSAPYVPGSGRDISVMLLRSTLMASIFESSRLKEHDYFNYVQNAYRWNLNNNNLELYSKIESGDEIILIFNLG